MLHKLFFLIIFPFTLFSAFAQKETYHWNFGTFASLDFTSGSPVPVNNTLFLGREGCASISDSNGNLLFYTNSETVWNKNNVIMENGENIGGNSSSTQCIILLQPGSDHIYYIITADGTENNFINGYRYSIVDVSQNSGAGSVISKNMLLHVPCSEKITVSMHKNNSDIWIITHEFNTANFVCFLLTNTGFSTPVISSVGATHIVGDGYMKTSPDGQRIALMTYKKLELFDFNKEDGTVSNPITIPTPVGASESYGIEFSPQGSKLYTSTIGNTVSLIYQYDLLAGAGSANDIDNSKTRIFPVPTETYIGYHQLGAIQNGPDGRMYIVRNGSYYLSVIKNPEELGTACNFVEDALYLGVRAPYGNPIIGQLGLPNYAPWYFKPPQIINTKNCPGDSVEFVLSNSDFIQSLLWNFRDPKSGTNNTSTLLSPHHLFSSAGTFEVAVDILYKNGNSRRLTLTITIPPFDQNLLGKDTLLCEGQVLTLDVFQENATYIWNTGSTDPSIVVTDSGMYSIKIHREQCYQYDTIHVMHHKCCKDNILPNMITPNGDGLNDTFYAGCIDKKMQLEIYNRWGSMVYKNDNYKNQWKADNLSDGIYYFILYKEGIDTPFKSWLHVIR